MEFEKSEARKTSTASLGKSEWHTVEKKTSKKANRRKKAALAAEANKSNQESSHEFRKNFGTSLAKVKMGSERLYHDEGQLRHQRSSQFDFNTKN